MYRYRRPRGRASVLAVALSSAAVLALTACTASGTSSTGGTTTASHVLTIGLLGDIGQPPDPDIYYANNGQEIILNVYQGLVAYQADLDYGKVVPVLATSWNISNDYRTYTFHLRSGVTFHDGTPFTSEAVKVSFARRAAVKGGAAYMVADVANVAAPNPLTAVVTLKSPNASFLDYLASGFGPKMESPTGLKDHAGSDDAQTYLRTHDLGTGPYELTGAQVGVMYTLTQYPNYWGRKSPFTTVNLVVYTDPSALQLAVQSGQVDLTFQMPGSALPAVQRDNKLAITYVNTYNSALIDVNPSQPLFSTQKARMAFLESIDQKTLVQQAFGATSVPATTLYGLGVIPNGSDKQDIPYDPSVMAAYVKALPKNTKMVIGYASNSPPAQQAANIEAAKMIALGLNATAQSYTTSQVFSWPQDPAQGPDVFIDGSNGPDGGSPYLWGFPFWDKNGGINYFLCDVPATDTLLNQALANGEISLYDQAAQLYSANGCYMDLAHNKGWIVTQNWVTGVPRSQNIGWGKPPDISQLGIAG